MKNFAVNKVACNPYFPRINNILVSLSELVFFMMFINTNISAHFNGIAHMPIEGFALSGVCLKMSLLSISAGHLLISP